MVWIWTLLVFLISFAFWRFVYFFRNPRRTISKNDRHILSPADGQVIYIRKVTNRPDEPILSIKGQNIIKLCDLMHTDDPDLQAKTGYLIGVFMGPFDVHYNRAPVRGHIHKISHDFPASPWSRRSNQGMFNAISNLFFDEKPYHHDCDYLIQNERASCIIKRPGLTVYVTQIADKLVHRIITYKNDTEIEQGDVFSLIRMGSQVDVFLPGCERFEIKVAERQSVKAGLSVLAEWKPAGAAGD